MADPGTLPATHPRVAEFDAASAAVAAAYGRGDGRAGRHLADAIVRSHLLPRVQELARLKVFRRDLAEDVAAHALLRIAEDWTRGKGVTWPMLQRIVVNCAVDLTRRDEKVPVVDPGTDDEARLEAFLAAEGAAPRDGTVVETTVLHGVRVDEVVRELTRLGRPRWVAYLRAWQAGYQTAPDIEYTTGIKAGRARQIRMDVCQFVRAYHPDLLSWLGCAEPAQEEDV